MVSCSSRHSLFARSRSCSCCGRRNWMPKQLRKFRKKVINESTMKRIIVIALAIASYWNASAQGNQELNSLIRGSFNYFPRIKELAASSEVNALRVDVAQSNYLPNVNGV